MHYPIHANQRMGKWKFFYSIMYYTIIIHFDYLKRTVTEPDSVSQRGILTGRTLSATKGGGYEKKQRLGIVKKEY